MFMPGGAGSYLRSCRFSEIDDRSSKEICQSFANCNEHARNAKDSCEFVRSDSTVENAVVFSYCLFTVSMFFCGSTKLNTTINQDFWNEMPVYTLF